METTECICGQYCLRSKCQTSDSGKLVKNCWCAECKDRRKEIRNDTYKIIRKGN